MESQSIVNGLSLVVGTLTLLVSADKIRSRRLDEELTNFENFCVGVTVPLWLYFMW